MKTDVFSFLSSSCVSGSSFCILQQSGFDWDNPVSFCIGFPRYFTVLDDDARFRLCGVDLKVSSRGFATV